VKFSRSNLLDLVNTKPIIRALICYFEDDNIELSSPAKDEFVEWLREHVSPNMRNMFDLLIKRHYRLHKFPLNKYDKGFLCFLYVCSVLFLPIVLSGR
jgi:hypothetical protein